MADKNNQDLYEGEITDEAVNDGLSAAVRHWVAKGKKSGYITMEELNKVLPPEKMSSEKLEDIMSAISEMGINIISASDTDEEDGNDTEEYSYDDDSEENVGNIDAKDIGHSDDPVRMYLKEMGLVELLSREGEIAISKRIEAGRNVMIGGLCESPMTLKAISDWRDQLVAGEIQLRDIVDLEMMYGDDAEAMAYDDSETPNVDDFEKVTKELDEKNLDEIDDDLASDIDLDDNVEDEIDESDDSSMEEIDESAENIGDDEYGKYVDATGFGNTE